MIVALTVPLLYDWILLFFVWARCKCFFCQAVSVVGRGSSPNSAVDVLSLFHIFLFWIRWNGRELYILPSCFPTAPLMSVSFALLFVLDIMWCCVLFADVCVLQKGGVLSRAGYSYPRSQLSWFFPFLYENILYLYFSFPLVYLFFLFFSLFFLSFCIVNMLGWFLSFFQIFSCLLYSIFVYSFFFLNIISLYKHWFLNFICFLTIVYKDVKKYLFLCV